MANKELLISLGLDASSFTQNVKRAKDLTKELDSSFKLLSESSEEFETSIEGVGKKQEYLSQKIEVLNGLTEVYSERMVKCQEEVNKASEQSQVYGERIQALREKLDGLTTADEGYKSLQKELKGLVQQQDKANKAVSVNNKRILEAKKGYNDTRVALQGLNKELALTAEKESALKADQKFDKMRNEITQLNNEFEISKGKISNFNNSMEGLQLSQNHYNEVIEKTTKLNEELYGEIQNSAMKLEGYESALKDIEGSMEEWNEILEEVDENSPDYALYSSQVEELRSDYNALTASVEFHKNRMQQLSAEYVSNQKNISKFEQSLDGVNSKIKQLNDNATFERLGQQVDKLTNSSIEELKEKLTALTKEFNLVESSVKNFESSITGLEEKSKLQKQTFMMLGDLLYEYSKEIEKTEAKIKELAEAEETLAAEGEKSKELLQTLNGAEWDEQKAKLEKLKEEYIQVNKELEQYKAHLKETTGAYDSVREKVSKLRAEVDSTQKKIGELGTNSKLKPLDDFISETANKLKILDSQFKMVSETTKGFSFSMNGLKINSEFLKEKLETLSKAFLGYTKAIEENKKALAELEAKQAQAKEKIEQLREALKNSEKDSPTYSKTLRALSSLEVEYEETARKIDGYKSKIAGLNEKLSETAIAADKAEKANEHAGREFVTGGFSKAGDKVKNVAEKVQNAGQAMLGLSMSTGMAGYEVLKTGGSFESQMSMVRAVVGLSKKETEDLSNEVRNFAKNTTYTAEECAQGILFLGQAGYDSSQSMKMLPTVLQLAQAGEISLSEASDLAVSSMASLGYEGTKAVEQLPRVLNEVAVSAAKTNSDVDGMMKSFIKVGGQAENLHIPVETLSAMLGVLANRGVKGEEAGNALNSILINMTQKSGQSAEAMAFLSKRIGAGSNMMFDSQGKIRSFEQGLVDLKRSLKGLSQQKQIQLINMIGGKTQAKTLQKLMQGMISDNGKLTSSYVELKGEIEKAPNMGALKTMADEANDNLLGRFKHFKAVLSEDMLKLFDALAPTIDSFLQSFTKLATTVGEAFSKMSPQMKNFIATGLLIATLSAPILLVVGSFGKLLSAMLKITGGTISFIGKMKDVIVTLNNLRKGAETGGSTISKLVKVFAETEKGAKGAEGFLSKLGKTAVETGEGAAKGGGFFKTLATTIAGTGAEAATGGGALATLGEAAAGLALPVAAGAAAIAGVGYAGYKTYKYLNESATPAVDLFADKAVISTTKIASAHGLLETKVQTGTIKISKATKEAVSAYLDMDKKASSSLMDMQIKSQTLTDKTKKTILDNFSNIAKKSSKYSADTKNNMVKNFKKLVSDTGSLTKKNKDEIIKQYTAMVNGTKKLSDKQKKTLIKNFQDTMKKSVGITKDQVKQMENQYKQMGDTIRGSLDKKRDEELKSLKKFFGKTTVLTGKEQADILKKTTDYWNNKKKTTDEAQKKIDSIIENASKGHRSLKDSEYKEINRLQNNMKTEAVKTLSENELEAKTILERMKSQDTHVTAEQASEHIKTLNDQRDNAIKAAEKECNDTVKEAIRCRDDTHTMTADQAEKVIKNAEHQRDETVKAAKDTRDQAVEKIKGMNSDISENVDTTTGDVLSKWDKLCNWWDNWHPVDKILNIFTVQHTDDSKVGDYMKRTNFRAHHAGGYAIIPTTPKNNAPKIATQPFYKFGASSAKSIGNIRSFAAIPNAFASENPLKIEDFKTSGDFYEPQRIDIRTNSNDSVNQEVISKLIENQNLILSLITNRNNVDVAVNLDGRQIARASAKYMTSELDTLKRRKERLGGAF